MRPAEASSEARGSGVSPGSGTHARPAAREATAEIPFRSPTALIGQQEDRL